MTDDARSGSGPGAAAASGPDLDAGAFGVWLAGMRAALAETADADVPCGTCIACCTSGQFVHIGPDERDTLAVIPRALLFPAPRLPEGHVLLGYDERGHCPMLVDGACSIYEHRPRACRTYDCRVLAAAGVDVAADGKPAIADRVARWRFAFPGPGDGAAYDSVRAAASYLDAHGGELPGGVRPVTATGRAVAAVLVADLFADGAEPTADDVARRLGG